MGNEKETIQEEYRQMCVKYRRHVDSVSPRTYGFPFHTAPRIAILKFVIVFNLNPPLKQANKTRMLDTALLFRNGVEM